MNTEIKQESEREIIKERNHKKLKKAHDNNIIISDMNLGDKYTAFEDSKLNESTTLLYEINRKPKTFKRYSRGRIIRVKFGVNIGSEFSGDHYAIVISKGDTMMSPTLHVIPLTSKKHLKNIDVGNILYDEKQYKKLEKTYDKETDCKTKKEIKKVLNYYQKRKGKTTYACIDHLKTISKLSICKTINEHDYLPNLKCSNDILKSIDENIIKEYTL